MPELNCSIPPIQCYVRREYFYNGEAHVDEYEPVVVFGVASVPGRALGFHCLTEAGAQFGRLPINAFCTKPGVPQFPLKASQIWDCPGAQVSAIQYDFLSGLRLQTVIRNWGPDALELLCLDGKYLFTLDWYGDPISEGAGDLGWKCAHVVETDFGNYLAMPNNKISWREPAFITKPFQFDSRPDYKVNERIWTVENSGNDVELNLRTK